MTDHIRILRVIEYSGPREEVEKQVENSIHGMKALSNGVVIKVATLGTFPEVIDNAELADGEAERLQRRIDFLETQNARFLRDLADAKGEVPF